MASSHEVSNITVSRGQVNTAIRAALEAAGAIFPVTDDMRDQLIGDIIEDAHPAASPNPLLDGLTLDRTGQLGAQEEAYLAHYAQDLGELRVTAEVLNRLGLTPAKI